MEKNIYIYIKLNHFAVHQKLLDMMKETEEDTNTWKDNHVHGLEELAFLKCPYYPKQSTDSMQSLSNYQWHFLQN